MLVRDAISRGERKAKTLKVLFEASIYTHNDIKIDYISIACNDTLKELKTVRPNSLISAAIFFKKVRLIDNFVYQSST
jgi:pantothenate synthetase